VRVQEVTPDIAESLGLKGGARGALVAGILPDGPAQAAQIHSGDIILSFNNQPIKDTHELPRIVADTEVGKQVPVTVWRGGKELTLDATLAEKPGDVEKASVEQPDAPSAPKPMASLGMTLAPMDGTLREKYHLSQDQKGVVITDVDQGGVAADKGLKAGDVIVEVQQAEVSTPQDVESRIDAVRKEDRHSVLMLVQRPEGLNWVPLPLDKTPG
jgi:serine protease Do